MKRFKDLVKVIRKRKKAAACAAAAFALIISTIGISAASGGESLSYETVQAENVKMEQTITAAGEIVAGESEEIEFETSSTFRGMCVEVGDSVRKGQHLISYSDGTYTDAPDNGVVTSIHAPDTGDTADSDDVISLDYTDTLILDISVPEDEISKVAKGDEAKITVNADTSKTFNGTITSVKAITSDLLISSSSSEGESDSDLESSDSKSGAEAADKASSMSGMQSGNKSSSSDGSSSYSVSMKLINDGSLRLGMSANCTITVSSRSDVLAVPVQAVQFDEDDQAYVNLCDGDQVTKTTVTTGESDANYVEIKKGLFEGDKVQIEVKG